MTRVELIPGKSSETCFFCDVSLGTYFWKCINSPTPGIPNLGANDRSHVCYHRVLPFRICLVSDIGHTSSAFEIHVVNTQLFKIQNHVYIAYPFE